MTSRAYTEQTKASIAALLPHIRSQLEHPKPGDLLYHLAVELLSIGLLEGEFWYAKHCDETETAEEKEGIDKPSHQDGEYVAIQATIVAEEHDWKDVLVQDVVNRMDEIADREVTRLLQVRE